MYHSLLLFLLQGQQVLAKCSDKPPTQGAGEAPCPVAFRIGPTGTPNSVNAVNFEDSIGGVVSTVLNVITLIAAALAVFYLIWAGIQYIISNGSPDKAKSARAAIINAIIGIVIIVSAYAIIRLAVSIGNTASKLG